MVLYFQHKVTPQKNNAVLSFRALADKARPFPVFTDST